jgi:hypothetical protein
MSTYQLAQLNIANMKAPLESPSMADFVANLQRINALAEASPGYIWRLQNEAGDATALRPFGDDVLVNLSVWRNVQALSDYVYTSAHTKMLKRRQEWFSQVSAAHLVLWWVPAGHRPSVQEAAERLALSREQGASAQAFSFRQAFPAPDALAALVVE